MLEVSCIQTGSKIEIFSREGRSPRNMSKSPLHHTGSFSQDQGLSRTAQFMWGVPRTVLCTKEHLLFPFHFHISTETTLIMTLTWLSTTSNLTAFYLALYPLLFSIPNFSDLLLISIPSSLLFFSLNVYSSVLWLLVSSHKFPLLLQRFSQFLNEHSRQWNSFFNLINVKFHSCCGEYKVNYITFWVSKIELYTKYLLAMGIINK